MKALPIVGCLGAVLLSAFAGAASADPTPRLWGTSYAVVSGPGDVVVGQPMRPVRVSTRLPGHLGCLRVEAVTHQAVSPAALVRDPLAAAPVTVVAVPAHCHGGFSDRWVNFVVGPTGSDILDVTLVTPDGRRILRERIAVETSTAR